MTTTATTTNGFHQVRPSGVSRLGLIAVAVVASGLAIVATDTRSEVHPIVQGRDPAAITAGLSQERLVEELTAIRDGRVSGADSNTALIESGLSQELLDKELAAIWRAPSDGIAPVGPIESGLSPKVLAEELAAIRGE